jgi:ferredoxin-NADP reductase
MLRPLAARGDRRPVLLLYGARSEGDLALREGIEALLPRLDLRVVYVLEDPPPGWSGETGYVDAAVLRRHLPAGHARMQYFVCGPPPLMDAMDRLLPGLGIPADRIHAERFDLV